MACVSSTGQVLGLRSAEPPRRAGFPPATSRPPIANNKPANHKLIDLHATDPRPSDHQPSNSERADRGGAYPGHSNGGISPSGRVLSRSASINLMTSSATIHHRPALLEALQAGSGGGGPRLPAQQRPWPSS